MKGLKMGVKSAATAKDSASKATEACSPSEASTQATNKPVGKKPSIKDKIAAVNQANALASANKLNKDVDVLHNLWTKFFSVQYNRNSMKKKQVEKKDGFLVIGTQYTILVDDESRKVAKGGSKKTMELQEGDKFTLEFFSGECLEELEVDQFKSGTCFLNLQAAVNKTEKKVKKLNQKEEDEVDPYAPTNGVDLNKIQLEEDDLLIHNNGKDHFAYLDAFLAKLLQKHQVIGVKFLYSSINKLNGNNINGCILADMMGLGKTIQAISLLWIMLKQCKYTEVIRSKKALIVTPSSLLYHWQKEIWKWLGKDRINMLICQGDKKFITETMTKFINEPKWNAMVISYDSFRIHGSRLINVADLLICDEGHKIKNRKINTSKALNALKTKRRIILTGTPIQNSLEEFFTLVDFINPGIFICYSKFKRVYTDTIQEGQQPDSNINQKDLSLTRMIELNNCSKNFILRRTSELLKKMLPRRNEYIIFCKMNEMQKSLYKLFCKSEIVDKVLHQRNQVDAHIILQLICFLRKIVNHPRLIYNYIMKNQSCFDDEEESEEEPEDEEQKKKDEEEKRIAAEYEARGEKPPLKPIKKLTKEELEAEKKKRREIKAKNSAKIKKIWNQHSRDIFPPDFESIEDDKLSSKFIVIGNMLAQMWNNVEEKLIIVSNYCETLDIFEGLCKKRGYPFIRFDGKTNIATRQGLVDQFNAPNISMTDRSFVFLLSAKAGGCGLNLIGCNRMILLDPDWNPSNDAQVMGRIWRVGQKRECFIYRMYASNSIEERILEIQRGKENLSDTVIDGKKAQQHKKFTDEVIANLFDYRDDEDKGLSSMDEKMMSHIKERLFNPAGNIEDLIQFYDLKVTDNNDDEGENEFDLGKKEEPVPDSDDEEYGQEEEETADGSESTTKKVGSKRPANSNSKKGEAKKIQKK